MKAEKEPEKQKRASSCHFSRRKEPWRQVEKDNQKDTRKERTLAHRKDTTGYAPGKIHNPSGTVAQLSEHEDFDDAGIILPPRKMRKDMSERKGSADTVGLSVVSKQYDMGGKGFLDETEQQLRNMDTENTGHLSNEKVYALMQHHIDDQRKLFQMKKLLAGITIFAALLALTTLATSFAAATLAKDTSASQRATPLIDEEALRSRDGSVAIGVHTIGHEIQLEEHDHGGGLADHACVEAAEVAQVWEEIASEFEVHLVLVKALPTVTDEGDPISQMFDRDLIPLTGVKTFNNGQICFTSFNEVAACVTFGDDACSSELGDDELATMTFPNTELVLD